MKASSRNSRFYRGALEHAGLGEAAYFLRKAKSFIAHAQTSLENLDPLGRVSESNAKIDAIVKQIGDAMLEIEANERAPVLEQEEADEKSAEEEDD